jgi:hypothetical protein
MDLDDSREALAYWDARARTLPRTAVRRRREARVMAERWHARVAEAESARYGGGWVGTLAVAVFERRVPAQLHRRGLRLARRARRMAMLAVAAMGAMVVLGIAAMVELVSRVV